METQIRLVEEDQASGRTKDVFEDIKRTMELPFVPDLFRATAMFPPFLEVAWSEAKWIIGTSSFEGLAGRIRAHARACALQRFYVPDHLSALPAIGMNDVEIAQLRHSVDCLHEADPRVLVIGLALARAASSTRAAAATRSLAGKNLGPVAAEMQEVLGVKVLGGDLALLGSWPEYLRTAWNDVKAQVRSVEFRRRVTEIRDIALGGLGELGLPRISGQALSTNGLSDDRFGLALAVVEDFGRSLPAVIELVALFRVGLQPVLADQLLELEAEA